MSLAMRRCAAKMLEKRSSCPLSWRAIATSPSSPHSARRYLKVAEPKASVRTALLPVHAQKSKVQSTDERGNRPSSSGCIAIIAIGPSCAEVPIKFWGTPRPPSTRPASSEEVVRVIPHTSAK